MGCGASTTSPHGRDTLSSVPPLPHDEIRYHRELESLEYISDAETIDEPSNFSKIVRVKAKCVVARIAHGITDDVTQFDEDIRESEPIFAEEEFDFIRQWVDEITVALAGAAASPIVEWDPVQAKLVAKGRAKHAPDSSRTVATRVAHANSTGPRSSPGMHSQSSQYTQPQQQSVQTPRQQQQQQQQVYAPHPHSLSDFITPHDAGLTSPETQSSSALGTTGDNFVLDSTSSNAQGVVAPIPASHLHHDAPSAAKYQVKTAAPLPPSPAQSLDRHKTKASIVKSPRTAEDERALPGQMIEAH